MNLIAFQVVVSAQLPTEMGLDCRTLIGVLENVTYHHNDFVELLLGIIAAQLDFNPRAMMQYSFQ